jgi:adenosylmethionine-8-amino-7-oxononanoate aminotransferase
MGMSTKPDRTWDPGTHPLWHGFAPMSFVIGEAGPDEMWVRGDDSWLVDAGGRRYLDARSGVGNMALGYGRRDIAEAMARQAVELPFVCTMRWERAVPSAVDCARALVDAAPAGLTRARFTHTGSAAVESAVLMARTYQRNLGRRRKRTVVALDGSYHGSTMVAMAVSGQNILHRFFGPMPEGFAHVPPPATGDCPRCRGDESAPATCVDDLHRAFDRLDPSRVAAFVVEPVKGISGVPLPTHYLRALRELCTRHDVLLVFDEVFSGFGRMGTLFAAELSGVVPDIMCLAKAITAGYAALGAVVVADHVYDAFNLPSAPPFAHASSTDAHPVACAAALATLEAFVADDVVARGSRMGERLRAALAARLDGSSRVRAIRALGAYVGVDLLDDAGRPAPMAMKRHLEATCREHGVLIDYTPDTVMLIPPLTTPDADADLLAAVLAEVVLDYRDEDVDAGALRPASLRGHR